MRVEFVLIAVVVLVFLALAGAVWLVWVPAGGGTLPRLAR